MSCSVEWDAVGIVDWYDSRGDEFNRSYVLQVVQVMICSDATEVYVESMCCMSVDDVAVVGLWKDAWKISLERLCTLIVRGNIWRNKICDMNSRDDSKYY